MTTAAIQKKIYEAIKTIDDIDFLTNIHQLVFDKASRGSLEMGVSEWKEVEKRAQRSKKNLKGLKSWKQVKKNILNSQ
jgi:hypothetical protein